MADRADLLVEIGTEELPPKALLSLSQAFTAALEAGLAEVGLAAAEIEPYASPRRLALVATAVPLRQADRVVERRGPAVAAAFDADGKPTKAAEGFARSCGVEVAALERQQTDKGEWLSFRQQEPGRDTAALLPGLIEAALAKLPIPKRMRWGAGEAEFVRPVHWVVVLLGSTPVAGEVLGVPIGAETRGHRFHHPAPLHIDAPGVYAEVLARDGRVIPSFAARREVVRVQVEEAAAEAGGRAHIEPDLLDEVTALVEWPVAVSGAFEAKYLDVPQEALISTMQDNQKYFPVLDTQGRLTRHFVTVSNVESRDVDRVREGNERVIRPRFADAEFFWNQDRRHPLASRREQLKDVVFEKRLGTLHDKSERLARLARTLAGLMRVDEREAVRAAELSKCDLMTLMVYEFTDLQGIMGRYYARHDGEPAAVAIALDEQYLPRFAGDALPSGGVGQVLALADRLDTLVGIFAIGQRPTGTKDPYGLRRAALGVLRILIEQDLDLDLMDLLIESARGYDGVLWTLPKHADNSDPEFRKVEAVVIDVFDYVLERLPSHYAEQGIAGDVVEAVLARRPTRPLDIDRRVQAVARFRELPEAGALAAANKRIANILKQVEGEDVGAVDAKRLAEPAEQRLHEAVEALREEVESSLDAGDYEPALARLAALREPVDGFFDEVMVMAEDAAVKRNRIALLKGLADLFLRTADLSRLQ
jgi:glycyl-tRNA synthetase beta chain